jgi:hypothetical protein
VLRLQQLDDYVEGIAHRGHSDQRSTSVDLGGEAADRRRELWRAWGGFGDGAAAWVVWRPAVYLASARAGGRLGDERSALAPVDIVAPSAESPAKPERADDVNRLPILTLPRSASNFDPLERRVRAVALAPSELVRVAETARVRVGA